MNSPVVEQKNKTWHNLFTENILAQLGSSMNGLNPQEAAQHLAADGPNELKKGAYQPVADRDLHG